MKRSVFSLSRALRQCVAVATVFSVPAAVAVAQGTGYWHTSGNRILDANNTPVRIAGINWYGFETTRAVAGGLTSQDYKTILQTIKTQGYNTVRIPFSNQMVETPGVPSAISYSNGSGAINGDLQGLNSLQVLDAIVTEAGTLGLRVILDDHRSEAGNSAESSGLWYTSAYPESAWINDWTTLASRYAGNATVIGFDLRNEPHNATSGGACWDCGGANDWHLAAERAGNAVLAVNPKLLMFVEGVDAYNNDYYWWGGNLEGVSNSPVVLTTANQLVYSAHDYGPTEYGQTWFSGSTTPASLDAVWTQHWGYIAKNGVAPVWLGEFGTTNDAASASSTVAGSEGQWFSSLVSYLKADSTLNWTYWALNGEDNYGLLDSNYDATPASPTKQSELASIQFPLSSTSTSATGAASGLTASTQSASQINLSWTKSATSGVTYTIYFGTASGSTSTVLASNVSATSYAATGLSASKTYYFTVTAVGSTGTSSAASNQASATTTAAAAPAAPSSLAATATSSSQASLSWKASATSGVTYSVYSGTSSGATTTLLASNVSATSYAAAGLTASTAYFFTVKAVSSAGGISAASNQASTTTQAAAAGSCHVAYTDQSDWGSGFTGAVSITNAASTAISSWSLRWTFAGNQQLSQAWSANYAQSGSTVTLTSMSYNNSIAAGATVSGIGFNASYSGANAVPAAFYLNGVLCK